LSLRDVQLFYVLKEASELCKNCIWVKYG